jgi:AAHS family 4-hydroxybenzoate transporter-like MFS transporter
VIDVTEVIDESPIGGYQQIIYLICGVCMVLDGFDVQAMGYVAPALLKDWGIDKASLGPVFGAGLSGLLFGSLGLSIVADKIGRRPVLIGSTIFFSVCMLATPLASNIIELLIIRFITGLGLGAIMPNAMALCGEFSPQRTRVFIMMIISCGFTVGALLGGVVAAALIPNFGWASVFYFGGAVPLVIAVLMLLRLPESLQFQALKNVSGDRIAGVMRAIAPKRAFELGTRFVVPEKRNEGVPVAELFSDGRAIGTALLWTISFLNLIALYFLSNWLPTIASLAGLSIERAVLLGAALQLGGTCGTVVMGSLINRAGFCTVLLTCFAAAFVSIALIGHAASSLVLLFLVVFAAGFAVVGGQPAINALAASFYPTLLRTTGVGWSLGVGRIGSVAGPVIGGELIRQNWSQVNLFYAAALPSLLIVLAIAIAGGTFRGSAGHQRPLAAALGH